MSVANDELVSVTASDGVRLAARRLGSGPPLYAVHAGPATDRRSFGAYLDPIASYRELHLFDQRGCGESEDGAADSYTLERLAQDIEEGRAELGHERVGVLGYSFGSIAALAYALRWPQHMHELVLVDGLVRGWRGILASPGSWWLWARAAWVGMTKGGDSSQFHLAHEVGNPDQRQEVEQLLRSPRRYDPARVRPLASSGRPHDLRPLLAAGVPVLGIYGAQDRRFVGEAGYLRRLGAQVELIDQAGHFPFVEQHERFHQVLEGFLRGLDGAR